MTSTGCRIPNAESVCSCGIADLIKASAGNPRPFLSKRLASQMFNNGAFLIPCFALGAVDGR